MVNTLQSFYLDWICMPWPHALVPIICRGHAEHRSIHVTTCGICYCHCNCHRFYFSAWVLMPLDTIRSTSYFCLCVYLFSLRTGAGG
ncbi:hypothetical protein BDV23DRAFT_166163 [Aspergillus alliaceus]|uniref:Uncharacterized protein n=1 Tax=Petromyces alliaceus TaxID=209559 RepID=A0A5N7BSI4_PETAA|nr:hypothetical protein BDV23DRAFT_166163 [Aspergillus alliaceus]